MALFINGYGPHIHNIILIRVETIVSETDAVDAGAAWFMLAVNEIE